MKIYITKTALMKQDNDNLREFNETLSKDIKKDIITLRLSSFSAANETCIAARIPFGLGWTFSDFKETFVFH